MDLLCIEALVINKEETGESDRIVTLFNKDFGKIKVLIKGIRKSKNREIYATDPLVLGEYKLRKKGEYYISTSLAIKNPYLKLKENFFKLELSLYMISLINKISFENISCHKIHKMTMKALDYIEKTDIKKENLIMYSFFIYKIIEYEGLKPLIVGEKFFNYKEGLIDNSGKGIKLRKMQFKYIEYLNLIDIDSLNELEFNDNEILELIYILEDYLNHNLSLELNIIKYFGEDI